jgi:hypothetical protein
VRGLVTVSCGSVVVQGVPATVVVATLPAPVDVMVEVTSWTELRLEQKEEALRATKAALQSETWSRATSFFTESVLSLA